eukprot:CAMPEP_0119312026 /NCGR_PEP_ID=MMETSP1333-20130426/24756_1 /TAXON_ID=418940 /ORGANISM="Scyphosphaera apsteinii, Strain RCC1455" /LENGTH=291 /DNA_ID=CAMNT_0007316561 /DNA_START=54 /DNA_END=929 /DNA_ORIENTATION=-
MARRLAFRFSEDIGLNERRSAESQPLLARDVSQCDTLETLQASAQAPFDQSNPRHMLSLEQLWHLAFPGRSFESVSPQWRLLGFQQDNPLSDLRGSGFMGLTHMIQSREILQNRDTYLCQDFPFAVASISCTAMLLVHFGLHPTLLLPLGQHGARASAGSTAALQNLIASDAPDPLQSIHRQLLLILGRSWRRIRRQPTSKPTEMMIMKFPQALAVTYAHLVAATRAAPSRHWLQNVLCALKLGEQGFPRFLEENVVGLLPSAAHATVLSLVMVVMQAITAATVSFQARLC